ncbi:SPFH domain-containing protein [Streptomyces sp. NBC_00344]|uniref:SPFH domain-containing protein n=1 Tax=Streptomyces sp. NBC_00344 TaxID=2975720 RepID=UPI002E1B2336
MTDTTAVPAAAAAAVPPGDLTADQLPVRRAAVIGNETTIEIPVHLLFREDGAEAVSRAARGADALEDAVLPAGAAALGTVAGSPGGRTQQPRKAVPLGLSDRPSPTADPRLSERPGISLPGAVALLGGATSLTGLGLLFWRAGLIPDRLALALGLHPYPFEGIGPATEVALTALAMLAMFAFLGLGRGRAGQAWVLSRSGDYRGSVRRTGLLWTSPLLLRRPVDVRLRHWRSEPMRVMDANGTALRAVVLVVWRIRDTAKASHGVADHEVYLGEQVEAAVVRVFSQLPADAVQQDAPSLRDAETVGEALTRVLRAEAAPAGIEVFSAQPVRIDYTNEAAGAVQRRRIEALDAAHRDSVLTSVVDAVEDTVSRLTARGLVDLDTEGRNALVKDLTIAFYSKCI